MQNDTQDPNFLDHGILNYQKWDQRTTICSKLQKKNVKYMLTEL